MRTAHVTLEGREGRMACISAKFRLTQVFDEAEVLYRDGILGENVFLNTGIVGVEQSKGCGSFGERREDADG